MRAAWASGVAAGTGLLDVQGGDEHAELAGVDRGFQDGDGFGDGHVHPTMVPPGQEWSGHQAVFPFQDSFTGYRAVPYFGFDHAAEAGEFAAARVVAEHGAAAAWPGAGC